jgi:hypothetical protein
MSATTSFWPACDTGKAMSEVDSHDDYDRRAHDRREIRRRLAMTPAERVRDNAAIYRLWVIGRKRHAQKVAEFKARQAASVDDGSPTT